MTQRKLRQLRKRLNALRSRASNIKSGELEKLARALGRKLANRGKEPTFISEMLPLSRPLSIPHHATSIKTGTARNILDQLEKDIDDLEELLPKNDDPEELLSDK
jgi:hypothetical protein